MAWCYELRGSDDRLVEVRSGFATQNEAQAAGRRAQRTIACICYPNSQMLTVVTRETEAIIDRLAEMPGPSERWLDSQPPDRGGSNLNLRYPWQSLVLDALLESHPENVPGKINIAERGLSVRLLDSEPLGIDERIAIGEALLALRRLIRELADSKEPADKEDIA
jgi:hypothetical protein